MCVLLDQNFCVIYLIILISTFLSAKICILFAFSRCKKCPMPTLQVSGLISLCGCFVTAWEVEVVRVVGAALFKSRWSTISISSRNLGLTPGSKGDAISAEDVISRELGAVEVAGVVDCFIPGGYG